MLLYFFKNIQYYDLESNLRKSSTMLVDIDKFFEKFTLEEYIKLWQGPILDTWDTWDTLVTPASELPQAHSKATEAVEIEDIF